MNEHIRWTPEEWAAVAKRAQALKAAKPETSWQQIVVISQDDVPPERRRFYFNKLSSLKPMFDLLGLDDQGNAPPPPPPPEPAPEPVVPPTPAPVNLADLPVEVLVVEVMRRGALLKEQADKIAHAQASVEALASQMNEKLAVNMKRVDEVEALVLKNLEQMDEINLRYHAFVEIDQRLNEALALQTQGFTPNAALAKAFERPPAPAPSAKAVVRFLLIGPQEKEIARIRERLPRSLNVELIYGENSDQVRLPANIQFCLVSGHHDFTRRWQTVRDLYGAEKAFRMENGSIGTFAHKIEELWGQHTSRHGHNHHAH